VYVYYRSVASLKRTNSPPGDQLVSRGQAAHSHHLSRYYHIHKLNSIFIIYVEVKSLLIYDDWGRDASIWVPLSRVCESTPCLSSRRACSRCQTSNNWPFVAQKCFVGQTNWPISHDALSPISGHTISCFKLRSLNTIVHFAA
jgi:hypothetical protein